MLKHIQKFGVTLLHMKTVVDGSLHIQFFSYYKFPPLPFEDHDFHSLFQCNSVTSQYR